MGETHQHTESAVGYRAFVLIWIGQAFSLLGSQLAHFALIWWLTIETGSATVLALATLVGMLPGVVLGPLAGTLVDRWNRRRVMIVSDASVAIAALVLAVIFATGTAQIWHVYVILFIRSAAGTFHFPAFAASTSLMIPERHLARVAGFNQMLQGAMTIVAPPLGALLLELLPVEGILAVDVVTASIAIAFLFVVAIPQPKKAGDNPTDRAKPSVLADLRAGFVYVRSVPPIMYIMGMAMVINFLFNPAAALTPLLVKDHFNGGALQLGWINSAFGIGIVVGGLTLGVWGGFKRRMLTTFIGIIGLGFAIGSMGVIPSELYGLALLAMLAAGIMQPLANGPLFAVLQATVEPEMQGRVFTLLMSGATLMSPLSLAVAGPVADTLGIQTWFILGGTVCVALGLFSLTNKAVLDLGMATDIAPDDTTPPGGVLPHEVLPQVS